MTNGQIFELKLTRWLMPIFKIIWRKKTYWSIAVPIGLFILSGFAQKLNFTILLTTYLLSNIEIKWLRAILNFLQFIFSINIPWWIIGAAFLLLVFYSLMFFKELKSKKIDTKEIIDEIKNELTWQPNTDWFINQCNKSIQDLDNRYTPELNFELEDAKIFDGLGRTDDFKHNVKKKFDSFFIVGKKVIDDKCEIKNNLKENIDKIDILFTKTDFSGTNLLPVKEIDALLEDVKNDINRIHDYYLSIDKEHSRENKELQYGWQVGHVIKCQKELSNFKNFVRNTTFKLANNPFLLLDGEAGIGKSHLLGDIVTKRMKNNYESIFLLGQHFVTAKNPWGQIFNQLQIQLTSSEFLEKLNQRAEKSGKRIIIFIDAINEGRGKYFWKDNINSFVNEIKSYEWLGLVLTIRTTYREFMLSDEQIKSLNIETKTLKGFKTVEYEASKLFFESYGIALPNVPLLHPEFQNPLFLKLFCEGISRSGNKKIPDGLQGISSIFNFFIDNVNSKLLNRYNSNCSRGLNLVKKSINKLIEYKTENKSRYIPYEVGYKLIDAEVSQYITTKGFIDELISEGVLSKNLFYKKNEHEEGVYLAYERFDDHLTVVYLLGKCPNLDAEFSVNGNLYEYVKDENSIRMNQGIIDAFSIQIPEKKGKDLYEYLPEYADSCPIAKSFVNSLIWRKFDTITEESINYVNTNVFKDKETSELFWETVLAIGTIPNHSFNAYRLHNYLIQFSLAERDASWTQNLKDKYNENSSVKQLIDWAWKLDDKSHISDESIKLATITLAWFHTSTNRQLRDCSTKAMVCLLQNRINVLIDVLKIFEQVNDPYVYERLFAVAYGCSLRTAQKELLPKLSEYIFETIFDVQDEVYPHVLLRDYARGVIEYTLHLGFPLTFDVSKVRPPYNSQFDYIPLTNEELDEKYKPKNDNGHWGKEDWGITAILRSMTTEHGRGTVSYGDFGRYTFQSALEDWNININVDLLSNLAIEWIFEKYGYDTKIHGKFDATIGLGRGRDTIPNERIGKKYQWLALHEMLARVSDNFSLHENGYSSAAKDIPYEGTWNPYVRDIDPTILIKKTKEGDESDSQKHWWMQKTDFRWHLSNEKWLNYEKDLPNFNSFISVTDENGEDWLILEAHLDWQGPKMLGEDDGDYPRKQVWTQIRSYLVDKTDYKKMKKWAEKKNFMGRWMPESKDRYEIFDKEYYWSPAHHFFRTEYYGGNEWREIYDQITDKFIFKVIVTTESYLWESEPDHSKEYAIRFLKPCEKLFDGIKMQYSEKEGVFYDLSSNVVCFDTSVHHNSKQYLIIKKDKLVQYLKKNNLEIIWTVIGEKQIIGGNKRGSNDNFKNYFEYSGAYYFDKEKLKGKMIGN